MSILKRTIRGIRDSIPSGYVIGRGSSQDGPAELISLSTLGQKIIATGAVPSAADIPTVPADFGFFFSGKPTGSQVIFEIKLPKAITLAANLTGSQAGADTAPTADWTMTLKKNGSSIGTIKFAATTGAVTITFASTVNFAIGDILQITGQSVADTTLADFFVSFVASFV